MSKISILVPTLGERPNEMHRLFNSLQKQTYKNFDVIIVSQDNFSKTNSICYKYNNDINIKHIFIEHRGISVARNAGLNIAESNIIVLSDDDCWYLPDSLENISKKFKDNDCDILLTQIFDLEHHKPYKQYTKKEKYIKNRIELMSRSSIEIAFRKSACKNYFDENMGLGSNIVCGEEIDFLLHNYKKNILYSPIVTVYHLSKNHSNEKQIIAKGYLYGKHYGIILALGVCFRDLFMKRKNNFKQFFQGFLRGKEAGNI